ncbi:calcium-binding protein [Rhodovulum kholense]|uniref:Hemolysin type calcium-binding protein n=1 Tax=Rhodovulum kholense TaxID=453584 RepID=A0A8E3ARJ0_9RHOB|nr:calcium-binding protein [Rhodovulum kholense]PTW51015.1 hemolysin type calcium-binding protein [Rhodovulum kholense]
MPDRTVSLSLQTGTGFLSGALDRDAFGGIYLSYNNLARFDAACQAMGLQAIRWPGGTLAETRADRYGFAFDDFVAPAAHRAGLTEMLAHASAVDASFSMILPLAAYAGDEAGLRAAVAGFMARLLGGEFGPLPREFTLELGNEYYAQDSLADAPALYGQLANAAAEEVSRAVFDAAINPGLVDVSVAVQAGRTAAEDAAIRGRMTPLALAQIDELVVHRFAPDYAGADQRAGAAAEALAAWSDAVEAAGGSAPTLFLSAWTVDSQTRSEALDQYVAAQARLFGVEIDPGSIDLDARGDVGFETFWQSGVVTGPDGQAVALDAGLAARDYGLAQARLMLETLASYAALGLERGAVYGIDMGHAGHLSDRFETFVAADMMRMMSESLIGTRLVSAPADEAADAAAVQSYVFEAEDRIVVFLTAGALGAGGPVEVQLDLGGIAGGFAHVWAESLTSDLAPDWRTRYGVPDTPGADESPEARLYETGLRQALVPQITGDTLRLTLSEDHQVIRLVMARTTAAIPALADWAGAVSEPLGYSPALPVFSDGSAEADLLTGGGGDDRLNGLDGDDRLIGGHGDDLIFGSDGDDALRGDAGRDRLHGNAGEDVLDGGAGNDVLAGYEGDDTLAGGTGDDTLRGEDGRDALYGNDGNDFLDGGAGADLMVGGAGDDTYVVNDPGDRVVELEDGGTDRVLASVDLALRDFGREIERLDLLGNDDLAAIGNGRSNVIAGNAGNNLIDGAWGDDQLCGGAGDDTFRDSPGNDRICGGAGADRFVLDANTGYDRVQDFEVGVDRIVLGEGPSATDVKVLDVAGDAVVRIAGGNQLKLIGVDSDLVVIDDFLFL